MNNAHTLAHMEGQQLWTDLIKANEEIGRLQNVVNELAPYTDSLICYASTISEHDGNRVAKLLNDSVTKPK